MTHWYACPESWSLMLRQYLPGLTVYSLIWEVAQLPFYTLWGEVRPDQIAYAVVHCTAGDILTGMAALLLALILLRSGSPKSWPVRKVGRLTFSIPCPASGSMLLRATGHTRPGCLYFPMSRWGCRRCCNGSSCHLPRCAGWNRKFNVSAPRKEMIIPATKPHHPQENHHA